MAEILNLSRRALLKAGAVAGGGLVLGIGIPANRSRAGAQATRLHAWIQIAPNGDILITVEEVEMGQGVHTSLPMILAEELEADWTRVSVEMITVSNSNSKVATSGSQSVIRGWDPLRKAGAAAREMLVEAAARAWGVSANDCRALDGRVLHPRSGRSLGYGELAERAATLSVPAAPTLKSSSEFRLIGRSLPRVDIPAKVEGRAIFGIDVDLPNLLHAAVQTSPSFDGALEEYDAKAALAQTGVRAVVEIPRGVAVVAEHFWQAGKGLLAAAPRFEEGNEELNSTSIAALLRKGLDEPAAVAHSVGDCDQAFAKAARTFEAEYTVPFLAHAAMEPMNCTAHVTDSGCEIWAPTQNPSGALARAADLLGIPRDRVKVHTTFLGGGFGRRVYQDFIEQAVIVSRTIGRPVKVIWTREEDLQHDFYRPAYAARLRAGFDEKGMLVAWSHRVVGPPITGQDSPAWLKEAVEYLHSTAGPAFLQDHLPGFLSARVPPWIRSGTDWLGPAGAAIDYAVPNQRVDYVLRHTGVPVGIWRGVGDTQSTFFVESFIDEAAHFVGADPYRFRRQLLAGKPRYLRVLDRTAEVANWDAALPEGKGRGIALRRMGGSLACQVAEVSMEGETGFHVDRIVCVVDCGRAVHPDNVVAQVEGGIAFGLSATLHEEITIQRGRVEQNNFYDYRLLRMPEMPSVEVYILESEEPPAGVGELSNPGVSPAITNAIFSASGIRVRSLPTSRLLSLVA